MLPSQRRSCWGLRRRQQSSTQHLLRCSSACSTWVWTETSCSRRTEMNSSGRGWSDLRTSELSAAATLRTGRPVWSTPPPYCQCYWEGFGAASWSLHSAPIPAQVWKRARWAEVKTRQWCWFGSAHLDGPEWSWAARPASGTWKVGPVGCDSTPGTRWRRKWAVGRQGWAVDWFGSWPRQSDKRWSLSRRTWGVDRLGQKVFHLRCRELTRCGWPASSLGEEVAGYPNWGRRVGEENQELMPLEFWEKVNKTSVLYPENLKQNEKHLSLYCSWSNVEPQSAVFFLFLSLCE